MIRRLLSVLAVAAIAAAALAGPAAAANRRVVGWGDSITYGFYDYTSTPPANGTCWAGPSNDPPETCGYVKRLNNRLNDLAENDPIWDISVLNLGKGGEATTEALSRIDRSSWTCPCESLGSPCPINSLKYWVCNGTLHPHDVMVLMEGTNDLTRNISTETVRTDLEQLVQKATANGLDVVITTLTPRHKYTWFEYNCPPASQRNIEDANTTVQNLNTKILDLANQTGWPLADVFTHFWKKKAHGLLTADYQNWQPMRCDEVGNPDFPNSGDPVGHPDADGFDLMTWKSEGYGQTYDETIEYNVKTALPPRLALAAPAPPITTGTPATFTVTLYDLAQTADVIWDFGDGTYLYSQIPATTPVTRDHVYEVPGTYVVTATAENFYGSERSKTATVDVTGADLTIFRDGFESADTSGWSATQP